MQPLECTAPIYNCVIGIKYMQLRLQAAKCNF